ncbi:MAG: A/G-specific adenine glycosylase [Acidobacteria bacterium]|nr:A/G-specific adenine glycosylase [Acidobacteriota bacterium]
MPVSLRQSGRLLLAWYRRNARDLPWRRTRDPYAVWVSEIMLQQTRVEAVIPYYERFLARFPDVKELAKAPEAEVLERWAGLGYYRRARQLQAAAKQIVERHGGVFPADYESIRELPGVGEYTAAAIAGIAFGLTYAALDGNVMRVMARLHNDGRDIGQARTRKSMQAEAQRWIDAMPVADFADFNQATIELGATICTPRSPRCLGCPLSAGCLARREGNQGSLPYKSARQRVEKLDMAVAIVERRGRLLMRQRPDDEKLMPGFWELPQYASSRIDAHAFAALGIELGERIGAFKHAITFRAYSGQVYQGTLEGERPDEYRWIHGSRLVL